MGALGYAADRSMEYLQTGTLEWDWGQFGLSVGIGAAAGAAGGYLRWRSLQKPTATPVKGGGGPPDDIKPPGTSRKAGRSPSLSSVGKTTVKMERHHLLPRQFKKFFEKAGLNIDDHTINLERNVHKIIHGKGGRLADSWNPTWERFIRANPEASAEDIIIQLDYMVGRFKLK